MAGTLLPARSGNQKLALPIFSLILLKSSSIETINRKARASLPGSREKWRGKKLLKTKLDAIDYKYMKILLVEDEKGVANFIKKGLEEEQYTVDLAIDGEEGLSLAFTSQYDLIVLDIMLPGINGIEICKQIRKKNIQTPVMMLTAKDSVRDKVIGLDSGADDYITKPFSFDEFVARVRALLRRKQDSLVELRYKKLRLDTLSHKVYVGDKEVLLRPKEYAILLYLLRNKGQALSRTQIIENVWGYDFNPTTNIVDVHIKSLREKIAYFIPADFIRSVRGTGYMIEEASATKSNA